MLWLLFCTLPKDQQNLSEKGKIINILGFVGQEENQRYYVGKYVTGEKNFHRFFTDKIKNIMTVIEYNNFCTTNPLMRIMAFFFL